MKLVLPESESFMMGSCVWLALMHAAAGSAWVVFDCVMLVAWSALRSVKVSSDRDIE